MDDIKLSEKKQKWKRTTIGISLAFKLLMIGYFVKQACPALNQSLSEGQCQSLMDDTH